MSTAHGDPRPIGVFDSGVGGLTVARALMDLLPDERLVYLGDTARGPYGPRPLAQVRQFTQEIVGWLAGQDVKLAVAACNTATAAAVETNPVAAPVPIIGVVRPAVAAAARATRTGRVGVIGTVGTIGSGAYDRAMSALAPDVDLVGQACPGFVELAEGGRTTDAEVRQIARATLEPLQTSGVDTLILGCTHYPLLTGVISYVMGEDVILVSSAEETARAVFRTLVDDHLDARRDPAAPLPELSHRFAVTGDGAAFARLANRFLGPRLAGVGDPTAQVEPDVRLARVEATA